MGGADREVGTCAWERVRAGACALTTPPSINSLGGCDGWVGMDSGAVSRCTARGSRDLTATGAPPAAMRWIAAEGKCKVCCAGASWRRSFVAAAMWQGHPLAVRVRIEE